MASFISPNPPLRPSGRQRFLTRAAWHLTAGLVLAGLALGPARADSVFVQAPPGLRQPLTARAHLDFRITIVPNLVLDSRQPPAVLVASGGGEAAIRPRWSPRRGSTPQLHQLEPVHEGEGMRWTCTEP